mgnify:CR=1 FL=1
MKVNSTEKEERKDHMNEISPNLNKILETKELNEFTSQEIDELSPEDLDLLKQKYQTSSPKTTILGKKPYESFLAGIKGDTWMSVGDKIKED